MAKPDGFDVAAADSEASEPGASDQVSHRDATEPCLSRQSAAVEHDDVLGLPLAPAMQPIGGRASSDHSP